MNMSNDVLKDLYGTTSEEEVIQKKTTEKQVRAVASGNKGKVEMSADECKRLVRRAGFEYFKGYEDRLRSYVTTAETVDRHGDIVRARGAVLDNYKKNPVIQFAHDYSEPPVGASLKTWYDSSTKSVRSIALFFDENIDPSGRSDLIYRFVNANAMRACSIGFNPIEYNRPKTSKEREKLGLGEWGVEFTKWDFLEFSPVPVPANPDALQDSFTEEWRKSLTETLKSGTFNKKDVDILRKYELFNTPTMDEFIKELDPNKFMLVEDDIKDSEKTKTQSVNELENGDYYLNIKIGENVDLSTAMLTEEKVAKIISDEIEKKLERFEKIADRFSELGSELEDRLTVPEQKEEKTCLYDLDEFKTLNLK